MCLASKGMKRGQSQTIGAQELQEPFRLMWISPQWDVIVSKNIEGPIHKLLALRGLSCLLACAPLAMCECAHMYTQSLPFSHSNQKVLNLKLILNQ